MQTCLLFLPEPLSLMILSLLSTSTLFTQPNPTYVWTEPHTALTDVDECRENPCGPGALCTNLPGGYECSCPSGFQGNPSPVQGCLDVDECSLPQDGKPLCGADASCVNTPGGYFCRCPTGFTGNPRVACVGEYLTLIGRSVVEKRRHRPDCH